jgi:hypothetical protein
MSQFLSLFDKNIQIFVRNAIIFIVAFRLFLTVRRYSTPSEERTFILTAENATALFEALSGPLSPPQIASCSAIGPIGASNRL